MVLSCCVSDGSVFDGLNNIFVKRSFRDLSAFLGVAAFAGVGFRIGVATFLGVAAFVGVGFRVGVAAFVGVAALDGVAAFGS